MSAPARRTGRLIGHGSGVRWLAGGLSVAALAWAGGFAWFAWSASRPFPAPPRSDGIVALTGGADRVGVALSLLAEDKGDRLLVTGIGGHAGLRELARSSGIDPVPLAGKVTLGRGATSTRGNALETAAWANAHGIRSLIVVTAFYHMPRALAEIGRALPKTQLHPAAVSPSPIRGDDASDRMTSLRLLASEYVKYIAVELGLSAFEPADAPHLSAAGGQSLAAEEPP
jgi:uncharacterized SAM-binding protein YcdF (DUF218 family)